MTKNLETYRSVADYAKLKKISIQTVYQAISRKTLDSVKLVKVILVKCQ